LTQPGNAPRIWVLVSDKAGDNAQVDAVVERLPWPVEYRRLQFKRPFRKGKPPFFASLYHVDKTQSDALTPPWPDLVITIGRRPAMAALWIRRQSGNRTGIVLFGRPKRQPQNFALIVVSAQFQVPEGPNVVGVSLPLMRVDQQRLARESAHWKAHFDERAQPVIAVLVGGATRPFVFDADSARELVRLAHGYCGSTGSLYVTTSRRTPPAAIVALRAALADRDTLYEWRAGASENPYFGLLAHASGFVVTGDSMSMITEVARLNRPLAIYPLRRSKLHEAANAMLPKSVANLPNILKYSLLPRIGFTAFPRDLTQIHRELIGAGFAVPAGEPLRANSREASDELDRVVQVIVRLASTAP
jgi:mitochondrial fission protein ELM1